LWPQHVFEKRARRFLFIRQRAFFRSARIDQDRERERQIDVLLKVKISCG
jgi:hypothetical protein